MPEKYPEEQAAVQRIRERNPDIGQRTLAAKIDRNDFPPDSEDWNDANKASHAPLATTYGRIRRVDAERKALSAAAA